MSKKFASITSAVGYLLMATAAHAQLLSPGPGFVQESGSGQDSVGKVFSTGVQLLFIAAAILSVVFLILGGIRWITSKGDKAGVEAARKQIVAAIIGLVVVAGAFLILNVVFTVLHVNNPLTGGSNGADLIPHL